MIVGICGYARSGKDTVADYLARGYGFELRRLSGPIKAACRVIFGWGDRELEGDRKESVDVRWGISPRQAMQLMGTEFAQYVLSEQCPRFAKTTGRTLWVRRAIEECDARDVVIPDVRFPHEADIIHAAGGKVWRIYRPGVEPESDHASETSVDDVNADRSIVNDGTVRQLWRHVDTIMRGEMVPA